MTSIDAPPLDSKHVLVTQLEALREEKEAAERAFASGESTFLGGFGPKYYQHFLSSHGLHESVVGFLLEYVDDPWVTDLVDSLTPRGGPG